MATNRKNVSRDELYSQVWSHPVSQLASSFGVTGTYIARICRELNVPTPPRGYWAQLEAGKGPIKSALPTLRPGEPTLWIRETSSALNTNRELQPPPIRQGTPSRKRGVAPHGLLLTAKEIFSSAESSYASVYLSPRHRKLVDLLTTKENLARSIAMAQKLFGRLEDYGYRVSLATHEDSFHYPDVNGDLILRDRSKDQYRTYPWRPSCRTVAYLGTVAIGLCLVEMVEAVKQPGGYSSRKTGSGWYRLYAYSPYRHTDLVHTWQDTKEAPLVSTLDSIITEMEVMARKIPDLIHQGERQARIAHDKWEAEKAEFQRQHALEVRHVTERESLESLRKTIAAWVELRGQQQFLEELSRIALEVSPEQRTTLEARIEVARQLLARKSALELIMSWLTPEERLTERQVT